MHTTNEQLRIPAPGGYRIDLDKVTAKLEGLVAQLAADARALDRHAARRMRDTASQIAYLARLQEQALARNGLALRSV
jgi:hypothetical protein